MTQAQFRAACFDGNGRVFFLPAIFPSATGRARRGRRLQPPPTSVAAGRLRKKRRSATLERLGDSDYKRVEKHPYWDDWDGRGRGDIHSHLGLPEFHRRRFARLSIAGVISEPQSPHA